MSEVKLVLKVELIDGAPIVSLGTGSVAVLSLASKLVDIEVMNQIMTQDEIATIKKQPVIHTDVPKSLITNL